VLAIRQTPRKAEVVPYGGLLFSWWRGAECGLGFSYDEGCFGNAPFKGVVHGHGNRRRGNLARNEELEELEREFVNPSD